MEGFWQDIPGFMLFAMATMAFVTVALISLTVGAKTIRAVGERLRESRRARLEPALEEFLITGEIQPELEATSVRERSKFLAPLMVERMKLLRGSGRERMANLARDLGLVKKLVSDLRSRDRWRRARAAENLGYFGEEDVVPALSELLSDPDETVRAVAARSLARLGTEGAVEALVRNLGNPSELTRIRIAENLDLVGSPATPHLVRLLDEATDPEREVHPYGPVLAARVLGGMREYAARPALRRAVLRGRSLDVRAQAARALGHIGDPSDVPLLLDCARDEGWPLRTQAANSLGRIGDLQALPVLRDLVSDREWWVRVAAGKALANMGRAGEKVLVELLDSEDRFARQRAAAALEHRGITRRFVREAPRDDERGWRARRAVEAVVRAGATRYLRDLAESLPRNERLTLEALLEGAPETEAPIMESVREAS